MKILLLIDNLGAGGAQRQLVGLAVMLKKKGYNVKVCCYQNNSFYSRILTDSDIHYEIIPNSYNPMKRIFVVSRFLIKNKPDWVIAYLETPSILSCVAKIFGGRFRLIVSERNTNQTITIKDRIRFFLFRFADFIVPNSFSQSDFISKNYPKLEHKVKIITNYVDLNKFSVNLHKRRKKPLIIIVASVWAPKNTINLIRAVSILKQRGWDVIIEWYGLIETKNEAKKSYQKECFELMRELNVDDMLSLLAKTKAIEKKYKEADYFCLPSFYEGTPNVICEAMASGCPIICSDVCDNGRYVIEGVNGFLFNPLSPEDIADKIEKALSISDETYEDYCTNSRKLAEQMLSEEKFINSYLDIIQ